MATERTKPDNWGQPQQKLVSASRQLVDPTAKERIAKTTTILTGALRNKYGKAK